MGKGKEQGRGEAEAKRGSTERGTLDEGARGPVANVGVAVRETPNTKRNQIPTQNHRTLPTPKNKGGIIRKTDCMTGMRRFTR